jgi:hypothetical protein
VLAAPLFVIGQALSRATSFMLGWATSLFFGQIPGGKERVVSMISALALAWLLITYVGGPVAIAVAVLDHFGVLRLSDARIDAAQVQAMAIGIVALPPLLVLIAELSSLTEGFSPGRWLSRVPKSYPVAISLGLGVALMLLVGPVILYRRRRAGRRTHHIPVLVMRGDFDELVREIEDELSSMSGAKPRVGRLQGAWGLPMRAMRYAGARLFGSVVRTDPVEVVAGDVEVAAFATDVNVTAREEDAYRVRAALYKRFGVGRMHLTWSARPRALEERLWELRDADALTAEQRRAQLAQLETQIDDAPIGSDEWNVLYRIVLQMRDEIDAASARNVTRAPRASRRRSPPRGAGAAPRERSRDRRRRS